LSASLPTRQSWLCFLSFLGIAEQEREVIRNPIGGIIIVSLLGAGQDAGHRRDTPVVVDSNPDSLVRKSLSGHPAIFSVSFQCYVHFSCKVL